MEIESQHAKRTALQDRTFLLLLVVISLAFGWILWPFYGAILWGTVLAIVFAPLFRRLARAMKNRRTPAALTTLVIILVMVILPLGIVANLLVQEAMDLYARIQSGEIAFGEFIQQMMAALPTWVTDLLNRSGLTNLETVRQRLSSGLSTGIQFVGARALNFGENALDFVVSFFIMLYLLFFLLRDGRELAVRIKNAIPLREDLKRDLSGKFSKVIRATIKGNFIVAIVQGALGGLIFWILGVHAPVLWGVLMAFLSLLPAVGTALVWLPVALYLLATGAVGKGLILIAFGVLVIGLVDNILRPILVGKDIKIPDYVVLIATLGGMAIFGLNGFIIGPMIAAMFIAVWDSAAASRARAGHESDG